MEAQPIFIAAAGVAYVMLFVHCARTRGARAALVFFGGCFLFGVLRDNLIWLVVDRRGTLPPFSVTHPLARIGHAAPLVAAGWTFTFYLGWFLADRLLIRVPRARGRVFPTLLVASLLVLPIAYATEAMGIAADLWRWTPSVREASAAMPGGVPWVAFEGWYSTGLDFLLMFFLIGYSEWRSPRRWWVLLLFPLRHVLNWLDVDYIREGYTLVQSLAVGVLAWTHPLRLRDAVPSAPQDAGGAAEG